MQRLSPLENGCVRLCDILSQAYIKCSQRNFEQELEVRGFQQKEKNNA